MYYCLPAKGGDISHVYIALVGNASSFVDLDACRATYTQILDSCFAQINPWHVGQKKSDLNLPLNLSSCCLSHLYCLH